MTSFSDKLLSLIVAIAMIIALSLIAFIIHDLGNLWVEIFQYETRINNLEILVIKLSKINLGV
jgi:hypothetical protein|tara:strand:+ start:388 stop:576 length:189 start_codon:yes stop_codon:yes gene_type:complete